MTKKDLAARLDALERELAALRAWRDGHACAQTTTVYQPQVIPNAWEPPCTCGQTAMPCRKHPARFISTPVIWTGDPFPATYIGNAPGAVFTVTEPATTGSASGLAWQAMQQMVTVDSAHPGKLRQVWPPKNPPDDPDMGVPALA